MKVEENLYSFFSLEMSSEQLSTRILAEQSRVKSNDIREERLQMNNLINLLKLQKILPNFHFI